MGFKTEKDPVFPESLEYRPSQPPHFHARRQESSVRRPLPLHPHPNVPLLGTPIDFLEGITESLAALNRLAPSLTVHLYFRLGLLKAAVNPTLGTYACLFQIFLRIVPKMMTVKSKSDPISLLIKTLRSFSFSQDEGRSSRSPPNPARCGSALNSCLVPLHCPLLKPFPISWKVRASCHLRSLQCHMSLYPAHSLLS